MRTIENLKDAEGYSIKWVWGSLTDDDKDLIRKLWIDNKAFGNRTDEMYEQIISDRIDQVCLMIIEDSTGELAGVTSAFERLNEQLESYLYYLRSFVSSSHRTNDLATHMIISARDNFESLYKEGDHLIGIFVEVENKWFKENYAIGRYERSKLSYIGKNSKGDHCRVYYFPFAKVFTKPNLN